MSKLLNKPTMTVQELSKKYSVSVVEVKKQLMRGIKVEKEHTNNAKVAREIALDHLGEKLDYYKKLAKIEEEMNTSGVRGLGYVSGDTSKPNYVQSYIDSNAMSYEDENGNKLEYIKKMHTDMHNERLGFRAFDPTKIGASSNKTLKEHRLNEIGDFDKTGAPNLGDMGGGRNLYRPLDVKEGKKIDKAKKVAMAGLTAANLYTLGDVAGRAAEGRGSPKRDIVSAATTLPGAAGWAATGVHYAKKAYDKVKSMKEEKEVNEDLRKWFREKWVRYDTKGNIKGPCAREEGEGKPKCRPLASARAMSKDERAKSARRKRREDPVADRPGKGGKPVMVKTNEETLLEKNIPTNPALWARAKAQAKAKFDVYPSAYANGWASKWYKSKGGGWKSAANESVDEACWDGYQAKGMKKKGNKMVPNCVPVKEQGPVMSRYTERPTYEANNKHPDTAERGIYQEGYASIGHSYDWAGDVNTKAKFYGNKPKPTTTKNDEKDDTYKGSKQGGKVKMVKSVKEDWQSVNRKDKTDGLSQKAVDAYKRENPGSKLQTAVTEKNPTGKRASRRKSFCSRMGGMKKRLTSAKTARDPDSRINKALRRWNCEESVINELKAETLGSYAKKAAASRKKSLEGSKPDIKTWAKRQKGITTAIKKLTSENSKDKDWDETTGSMGKSPVGESNYINKPYTKIHEETTMDNKEIINEAIVNILENDLNGMKENFMLALQEKAMEKIEERKKDIASNYFAQ